MSDGEREREGKRHAEGRGDEEAGHEHDERRRVHEQRNEHRQDRHARRTERPGDGRSVAPHLSALGPELLDEHGHHQDECDRQDRGNRRPRQPARRQPLCGAGYRQAPCGHDEPEKEADRARREDRVRPPVAWAPGDSRTSAVTRGCWFVAERGDAADAHQPAQEEPGDLLGPGKRLPKDVTSHDLQADDRGLGDDEDGRGPLERAIRERQRALQCCRERTSRADRLEPLRRHRASALRCSRAVRRPSGRDGLRYLGSSCRATRAARLRRRLRAGPIARCSLAASIAACSIAGRNSRGMRASPTLDAKKPSTPAM